MKIQNLTLFFFFLLLQGCLNFDSTKTEVNDEHDFFKSQVTMKLEKIREAHGACAEWNSELQKTFQTTDPESQLRARGQIFQLVERDPKKILTLMKEFNDEFITRYSEYDLYRLPLDFPRSDRNLSFYLETTKNMPECHSLFDEYGLMHALIFETIDHKMLKREGEKLILEYLLNSLENQTYPFINLLTNAALMRSLASVGILPTESSDAFAHLLMQIEAEQQRFMETVSSTMKSTQHPTLEEYRAILALNEDREEKTKFYQKRLFDFLNEYFKK